MSHWHLDQIADLLIAGGRIALQHYESPVREHKRDGSIVTQADREIEAFLGTYCDQPAQGRYLLGEETAEKRSEAYLKSGMEQTLFIVDPIDGTAPYASHLPTWGVSIGMAVAGTLTEGAIYLPITGELFASDGDRVCYLSDATALPRRWQTLPHDLATYTPGALVAVTQNVAKGRGLKVPNPIHALACAVMPLAYLLHGRYVGYVADCKLWDIAGGLPMLLKLGLTATFRDGRPLTARIDPLGYKLNPTDPARWAMRDVVVFAPPSVAPTLLHALGSPP